MGVPDGFEFIQRFQTHGVWRGIPIVVMTAKDLTDEDHRRLNGYVEQILRNLLSNAAKYGGDAPISVETRRGPGDGEVTIAVRDNDLVG